MEDRRMAVTTKWCARAGALGLGFAAACALPERATDGRASPR